MFFASNIFSIYMLAYFSFWKFNETLTNDVFSFEQPGPG